jgi:hypothetical protein
LSVLGIELRALLLLGIVADLHYLFDT